MPSCKIAGLLDDRCWAASMSIVQRCGADTGQPYQRCNMWVIEAGASSEEACFIVCYGTNRRTAMKHDRQTVSICSCQHNPGVSFLKRRNEPGGT
jgi:hypothetical protein